MHAHEFALRVERVRHHPPPGGTILEGVEVERVAVCGARRGRDDPGVVVGRRLFAGDKSRDE